jgi:xanthine dehydrogenase accessory factor
MSELKSITVASERLRAASVPFLVATVVRVTGSSYRRPGARMLLTRERWVAGSVSGGCLEGDVLRKGWWRTRAGPALVTYDATAQDEVRWGFGLGCDGVVDVLLERAEQNGRVDPLAIFAQCLRSQKRAAIATVFRSETPGVTVGDRLVTCGDRLESDAIEGPVRDDLAERCATVLASDQPVATTCTTDGFDALIEPIVPPVRLFVCGAGHDALPLVQMAALVGWDVVVYESNARFATHERFGAADVLLACSSAALIEQVDAADCAAAVVIGHEYDADRTCLGTLLASRARYIGVLGPRRRTERMLGELAVVGDERVHAPVGLAIGAETPQQIALAIVAEIQSVLARAPATSLCRLPGPIHVRANAAE